MEMKPKSFSEQVQTMVDALGQEKPKSYLEILQDMLESMRGSLTWNYLNVSEAKDLFIKGDLETLDLRRPAGSTISQIFLVCIEQSSGEELDQLIEKNLFLKRRSATCQFGWEGMSLSETDEEYRERAKHSAAVLDFKLPKMDLQIPPPPEPEIPIDIRYSPIVIHTPLDHVLVNISIDEPKVRCNHSWKEYVGFTQRYDYCEHCDEKKK